MNVHHGGGGVDGESMSVGIASLPKGERSPPKKHQCITKNRTYEGKKEGAGHSIPVFWDPVVLAFDQNFLIFFRLFLLVGNSLLLTRSFQIL